MLTHEEKISRISHQLKKRKSKSPISLKKKAVTHQVPKPGDQTDLDEKIDVSDLNKILHIDHKKKICVAEPGVTFVDLVQATLKHNLVPIVVPELKTITIGGAVAGCSIESMSYHRGGFHDNCLEYEVITAKGEVLICRPDNEHALIFQMMHGTFGTLGIITKLTFKLVPAKPFVKVVYEKYPTLDAYKKAIWSHYQNQDVDFMDGIIHSPSEWVLSVGQFVDEAPYHHAYDWMRIYYLSTKKRKEDYLKTADYFFRYDKGVTNVMPKSFLGRLLFGKFLNSGNELRFFQRIKRFLPSRMIPVTVDLFIPFSKATEFMEWYQKEINFFPLWCVPYQINHRYEWISKEVFKHHHDKLFLDLAIYGLKKHPKKNYHQIIEQELMKIGGVKTLISENYYSEVEFWRTWNKENYEAIKQKTDPDNIFRGLYEKMCRVTRGLA